MFNCPMCRARFTSLNDLTNHVSTHRENRIPKQLEEQFKQEKEYRQNKSNYPQIWDWEKDGETFIGKIQMERKIQSPNGDWRPVECLMRDGNVRTLAVNHTVLIDLWEEKHPKVGDIIAVRNLGKPQGKPYFSYLLLVNPEGVEIEESNERRGNLT
jgi:hypothetical protein